MIKPSIPYDETQRLKELDSYSIMDTAPESAFDELTWLAGQIAQAPVALISLVDSHRQWFKSAVGTQTKEIPRDVSFCAHIVGYKTQMIVKDATMDPRFAGNPLVTEDPQIRFYAGFPLMTNTGHVLGALCVIDHKVRTLSEEQIRSLQYIARQAFRSIEMRRSNQDLRQVIVDYQTAALKIETQQNELEKGTRLRALGQLAGGIAHEVNNPLAIISGKAQIMVRALNENTFSVPEMKKHLEGIQKTCDRIVKITRGLTKFSRDGSNDPLERVNVKTLIEEVEGLFSQKLNLMEVDFQKEGPEDLIMDCRQVEISQVLLNLVGNALDAMDSREQKSLKMTWAATPSGVEISVQDNGNGIPETIRNSIMNPFFTTKPIGKGTGLGLSIAKGICESHKGQLILDPRLDVTRFVIRLPSREAGPTLRQKTT